MPRCCLLALSFALLLPACGARSQALRCPERITDRQQIANEVNGWRPVAGDTDHPLASVTFFDGPPEEHASLVNDSRKVQGSTQVFTWRFLGKSQQFWLACGYFGTSLTLTRPLPASVQRCSVTYSTRQTIGGLPFIQRIDCK